MVISLCILFTSCIIDVGIYELKSNFLCLVHHCILSAALRIFVHTQATVVK